MKPRQPAKAKVPNPTGAHTSYDQSLRSRHLLMKWVEDPLADKDDQT